LTGDRPFSNADTGGSSLGSENAQKKYNINKKYSLINIRVGL
jgi:hypothetical protein